MRPARQPKPTIGWREWLALPALGVRAIEVKVDTGARSSALHAVGIERFRRRGRDWVRFAIHPRRRSEVPVVRAEALLLGDRRVRNPGGVQEVRPVIETEAVLGEVRWPIELTLTARTGMEFRMLLGRSAIRGRFLVNPGRSFLAGRRDG